MKSINEYINESSSLIDRWTGGYANNYLKYNEGDKKFSELEDGDKIYFHNVNDEDNKIIEYTVKGKLIKRGGYFYVRVYDEEDPKHKNISLTIGPVDGLKSWGDKDYNPDKVNDSSMCISFHNESVFGTNRDDVLTVAKSNVTVKIGEINDKIKNLKESVKKLKEKLDVII